MPKLVFVLTKKVSGVPVEYFTPIPALIGGTMIGLASAILWVANGRIAGISGVFGQLLPPARTIAWRLLFLVALVAGGFAASYVVPGIGVGGPEGEPARLVGNPLWIAIAGLLVGVGTKVGNGCTSGHGVCGLARFSLRSLVAVVTFFGVAIITVAVTGVV
jgi:hypothetical protein